MKKSVCKSSWITKLELFEQKIERNFFSKWFFKFWFDCSKGLPVKLETKRCRRTLIFLIFSYLLLLLFFYGDAIYSGLIGHLTNWIKMTYIRKIHLFTGTKLLSWKYKSGPTCNEYKLCQGPQNWTLSSLQYIFLHYSFSRCLLSYIIRSSFENEIT